MRDMLKLLPFAVEDWDRLLEAKGFFGAREALEAELSLAYGVRKPLESNPADWNISPRTLFTEAINRSFRIGWATGMAIRKHTVQQKPPGESLHPEQTPGYDEAHEACWDMFRQAGFEAWADRWPDDDVTLPRVLKMLTRASMLDACRAYLKAAGMVGTIRPSLN